MVGEGEAKGEVAEAEGAEAEAAPADPKLDAAEEGTDALADEEPQPTGEPEAEEAQPPPTPAATLTELVLPKVGAHLSPLPSSLVTPARP